MNESLEVGKSRKMGSSLNTGISKQDKKGESAKSSSDLGNTVSALEVEVVAKAKEKVAKEEVVKDVAKDVVMPETTKEEVAKDEVNKAGVSEAGVNQVKEKQRVAVENGDKENEKKVEELQLDHATRANILNAAYLVIRCIRPSSTRYNIYYAPASEHYYELPAVYYGKGFVLKLDVEARVISVVNVEHGMRFSVPMPDDVKEAYKNAREVYYNLLRPTVIDQFNRATKRFSEAV